MADGFFGTLSDSVKGAMKGAKYGLPGITAGVTSPAIKAGSSNAANYVADRRTESEYKEQTGQDKPAQEIYKEWDNQEEQKSQPQQNVPPLLQRPMTQQDQANQEAKKIKGSLEDTSQDQKNLVAKGYTPPPNAKEDPVGYVSSVTMNKSKGLGGTTGEAELKVPEMPTQAKQEAYSLDQQGKQASFDMSKIPVWYESDAFNMGLISFGLNLLSGNDLATSFNQAGNAFSDIYGKEKRQIWSNDLINQGYSPQEIQQWIETGDSKILTSPEERKAQEIQLKTGMANLNKLEWENSPEMRDFENQNKIFDQNLKKADLEDRQYGRRLQRDQMNQAAQFHREQMNFKNQQLQAKGNTGMKSVGGVNVQDDGSGNLVTAAGYVLPTDRFGKPMYDKVGNVTVIDPRDGRTKWIPQNQQKLTQARQDLDEQRNIYAELSENGDAGWKEYFGRGVGNAVARKASDYTGSTYFGKGTADREQMINRINGLNKAIGIDTLTVVNGNKAVTNQQAASERDKLGTFRTDMDWKEAKKAYEASLNYGDHLRHNMKSYVNPDEFEDAPADRGNNKDWGIPVGTVDKASGYVYIGGNPNDQNSWKRY